MDYSTSFVVDQTPDEVFKAINNVRGWWSGDIEGDTDKVGAEFTYSVKDVHRSRQKITELVPGKRVVWHVLEGSLAFVKGRDEWKGTDIVFDISRKGDKTELRFTHRGQPAQADSQRGRPSRNPGSGAPRPPSPPCACSAPR